MHFEQRTTLGASLRLCLMFLAEQLRAAAYGLAPLTRTAAWRIDHARARLHTLVARLDWLAFRWREGTLPRPRTRTPRPAPTPQAQPDPATPLPPARPRRPRDPSAQGWLARVCPHAAGIAHPFAHMLETDPEFRAFVAAVPQAGRLLRPLARMLGAPLPDYLRLPPRPRRPCAPRPRPPRQRPPSLTDPSLGLQPYVIAAVRYWRRKKMA
jgi:hypothetical protein